MDLVADHVGLDTALPGADLVVTGEGALDAESFNGKVVGGVILRARQHGIRPSWWPAPSDRTHQPSSSRG